MNEYKLISQKSKLRGPELIQWAEYIDNGGLIYPLSILSIEGSTLEECVSSKPFTIKDLLKKNWNNYFHSLSLYFNELSNRFLILNN